MIKKALVTWPIVGTFVMIAAGGTALAVSADRWWYHTAGATGGTVVRVGPAEFLGGLNEGLNGTGPNTGVSDPFGGLLAPAPAAPAPRAAPAPLPPAQPAPGAPKAPVPGNPAPPVAPVPQAAAPQDL